MYSNTRPTEHKGIISAYSIQIHGKKPISTKEIIQAVSDYFNIDDFRILSKSRKRQVTIARFCGMYLMRKQGLTFREIAETFNRDHTTAIHSVKFIEDQLSIPHTNDFIHYIHNINLKLKQDLL